MNTLIKCTKPRPSTRRAASVYADRAAAQEFARENLKLDFHNDDTTYWTEQASKRGMLLPDWWIPATGTRLARYAEQMGLNIQHVIAATGCRSFKVFAELNPTWPLFAQVGLLLELADAEGVLHNLAPAGWTPGPGVQNLAQHGY